MMTIEPVRQTHGFQDASRKPDEKLMILPGAAEEADKFLQGESEHLRHLQKVADLISGFETPYGMELLSSVHWVAKNEIKPGNSDQEIREKLHSWNARKQKMTPEHIKIAKEHLVDQGWLSP